MKHTLNSCNAKYLSVNGKANNDKEVAKGSYHYANLVKIKIKIILGKTIIIIDLIKGFLAVQNSSIGDLVTH